jgi:GT2 family glycosyltransferase
MTLQAHSPPRSVDVGSPPQTAVVILGMARSGTSAVTRLLALLGVQLGPQQALLPPAGENAKGFFEHRGIMGVNKELLERMGGSWSQPPRLTDGWQRDARIEDLRVRARELIAADFAAAPLWGFKDPRTSLTLPFWDELLREHGRDAQPGRDVRYVICHRRPLDSARSLQQRDRIRLDDGIALWTHYTAAALAHTARRPRILISYEGLFGDRHALVGDLAGFLGVIEQAQSARVRAEIDGWIEEGLRHHTGTLRELVEHPAVSPEAQALHLLLELAGRSRGADGEGIDAALDGMARTLLRRHSVLKALPPGSAVSRAPEQAREKGLAILARPAGGIDVSIVVVLGDDPWGAMACLESLSELAPDSPPHEIVLVDNASLGLRATLAALEGDVQIVRLPERVTVDEALRAGETVAGGEIVICMPCPALLAPDALTAVGANAAGKDAAPACDTTGNGAARASLDILAHTTPPPAPLCRRGPGSEPIEVSVVIPTLDAASDEVRQCLRAVQATIRVAHEIIVIDNGAPPQGFTAPVNAALRAARGRHLVVMNDDVRVLDGWWEPLAAALDGGAPLVFPLTVEGRMRWDFAAWCFAMRRETFHDMANQPDEFFDPSMVVWCQDADLRKRLTARGAPPLCVPESHIRHVGSRTVRVTTPHNALRNWIHDQAARDTAVFRARYPEETSASDGLPPGVPVLTPEHVEVGLSEDAVSFSADGPAWESHTLAWPPAVGHFFLAGELDVRTPDSVQDILVRAIFAGEERELYWIDLVPGVLGSGRAAFAIPRERARAIRQQAGEEPADWGLVRSLRLCARSRLRGALRRAPAAPGASTAVLTNLRLLAQPPARNAVTFTSRAREEREPAAADRLRGTAASLGIAVITYRRRDRFEPLIERLQRFTHAPHELVVAEDGGHDGTVDWCRQRGLRVITGENRGVARNKNRGIFALASLGCDPILVIEDDIYPDLPGWEADWIAATRRWHHLAYLHPKVAEYTVAGSGTPEDPFVNPKASAALLTISRHALAEVGYLDSRFIGWGHAHGEWTTRIKRAGYGFKPIVLPDGSKPKAQLYLVGGLVDNEGARWRDEESGLRNRALYKQIYPEPIFRRPWRSPQERAAFLAEQAQAGIDGEELAQELDAYEPQP